MKALFLIVSTAFASCAVLQNDTAVYQQSKKLSDTAFVYSLPYAKGTAHRVWQGYHSLFSHWGNFAIDFKMKKGTSVHAAREGIVVFVKEDETKGGVGKKYVGKENGITIKHNDGTYAHYLHLQHNGALVTVGDTVKQGQIIGLSGSTGFSAFPHLHFEVTEGMQKAKDEIPVRFRTAKGVTFLRPLRRYKAL
jgi:murein DD-endopeptidase MepM/ murein hydrolase activator NlpD